MDLGAFLQAGRDYPVVLWEPSAGGCPVRAFLSLRRGRLFWMAAGPLPVGSLLLLSIEMKGFVLEDDASLAKGGQGDAAELVLAGRLKASRHFSFLGAHVLHLELLGRVLP